MKVPVHDTTSQTQGYSQTADENRITSGTFVDNSAGQFVKNSEKPL